MPIRATHLIRAVILALVLTLAFVGIVRAETITVQYDEPDESVAANLDFCTIYWCRGISCTDWYPLKDVDASAAIGGGEIITTVNVPTKAIELPKYNRIGISCTDTNGAEGPKLTTGTNNPFTFLDVFAATKTLTDLVDGQHEDGTIEWTATCVNAKNNIVSAQLYANGLPVGSADTTYPYSGAWATGFAVNTSRDIKVRCTDAEGKIQDTAVTTVAIDVTAPVVTNLMMVTTETGIVAQWDVSELSPDIVSTNVQRCNPAPCTPCTVGTTTDNPHTLTGLDRDIIYDWAIQAVDRVGNLSAPTNKVTASMADLVSFHRLNNNCNDDAFTDNNCALQGNAAYVDASSGKVLTLDGNGDYARVTDHDYYVTQDQLTVAAWINCDSRCTTTQYLMAKNNIANRVYTLRTGETAGSLIWQIFSNNTAQSVGASFGSQIPSSGWIFVAGTFDGSELILYKNAVVIEEKAFSGFVDLDVVDLTIGATGAGTLGFNGLMSRARVYNRALSQAAIEYLYLLGAP